MCLNKKLSEHVLNMIDQRGVQEICVCPGGRNAPLIERLSQSERFKCYYWNDERSAAFFSIGRARVTERPLAVITTSGTAAGELFAAAMEAYYSSVPLILITADRPKRFRGSCAPQSAEQPGIFGMYAPYHADIDTLEGCDMGRWEGTTPAHLNVCFDEPLL